MQKKQRTYLSPFLTLGTMDWYAVSPATPSVEASIGFTPSGTSTACLSATFDAESVHSSLQGVRQRTRLSGYLTMANSDNAPPATGDPVPATPNTRSPILKGVPAAGFAIRPTKSRPGVAACG